MKFVSDFIINEEITFCKIILDHMRTKLKFYTIGLEIR